MTPPHIDFNSWKEFFIHAALTVGVAAFAVKYALEALRHAGLVKSRVARRIRPEFRNGDDKLV